MKAITSQVTIDPSVAEKILPKVKHIRDFQKALEANFLGQTTRLVDVVLGGAIILRASDIHLEPEDEERTRLRIRIDGVLEIVSFLPAQVYKSILGRIKLSSGLKLNITQRSQDGRFTIRFEKREIEIRTSILPFRIRRDNCDEDFRPSFLKRC